MSRKEIKKQNKELELHIIDIISKFDPSGTGKYTKFLVDLLKSEFKKEEKERAKYLGRGRLRTVTNRDDLLDGFKIPVGANSLESTLIQYLEEIYGHQNIETLFIFNEHLKNNRISEGKRDINNYKNWEELSKEVSLSTIKYRQKQLEKEVLTVFDSSEWLVIRPLTFESSLTYGSGTKWCTASRNNREYFYRYSRNGVLCYVISKIDGDKFGVFYDIEAKDFSIWDAPDRRIDSLETSIPRDLMVKIFNYMKSDKNNVSYFSEEERKKCNDYEDKLEQPVVMMDMDVEIPTENIENELIPMPDEEYDADISNDMSIYEEEFDNLRALRPDFFGDGPHQPTVNR